MTTVQAHTVPANPADPAQLPLLHVIRRDGTAVAFDRSRISVALNKAFLAVEGSEAITTARVRAAITELTDQVEAALTRDGTLQRAIHIEDIQDQVELALMRAGHHRVARSYVLYREAQQAARTVDVADAPADDAPTISVRDASGALHPLDRDALTAQITAACDGVEDVSPHPIIDETLRTAYDGIAADELAQAPVLAARALVETEPGYRFVAARLLLDKLRAEALGFVHTAPGPATQADMATRYAEYFGAYVRRGVDLGHLDRELRQFDLDRLGAALDHARDLQFDLLGLQTLYDRYLLHHEGTRFELPQAFFMRVAMGLALREAEREERAIEFYRLLSSFDFMCSTPTLFNAGTPSAQLSSCFLTTVPDDLDGIFSSVKQNALLSKYAGGLGNDWTPVRGLGAHIRGTNGQSQGIVPFLKIANDTAVAVNQGGKRKGAVCAYLETWHIDVEEFCDLRKNTGDDRRRTHDMNTAHWVPDEFLRRVEADGEWTLFSPDEVGDLHDAYGQDFAERYRAYEDAAARGEIKVFRTVRAVELWRRMLTMLFETGHPWITFKDPCNLRSPQQHVGTVHSSNLCTEITLNTSVDEVAVCNLGSVNLAAHTTAAGLDRDRLAATIRTAVRMLDNVIDVNYYTVPEARRSNLRHRPIGMGVMGFADALVEQRIPIASDEAVAFADTSMELVSHLAISASADLAAERGRYASFDGSLWSQGVLPIDSLARLADARGGDLAVDTGSTLDWDALRERVRTVGVRNSNIMAIAPTATIANITGVSQSIEPPYRNLYVKANMSGDFVVSNARLVADLKARGLWDEVMVADLKYFDGSLQPIDRVPDDLKALYATAFEVDPRWLVDAASRRQKWIDQAQSLNLYVSAPSGRALDELYRHAWRRGLKTTYYLRSTSATHVEKSTLATTDGRLNAVPATLEAPSAPPAAAAVPAPAACSIEDPECEACQ